MRFILAFILLLALTSGVSAQYGIGSVYYSVGFPTGDMRDFVSKTSWRGFGLEGRKFMSDKTSVGIAWQWNTFHEQTDRLISLEIENIDGDVSGHQFRRVYATPILVTGHYYLQSTEGYRNVLPYLGVGVGAYWIQRRLEIGIVAFERSAWHFALAPEGGVIIPMGYDSNLILNVKYCYAFESGDSPAYAYWNINIGVTYSM